jgi:hypothetical protein
MKCPTFKPGNYGPTSVPSAVSWTRQPGKEKGGPREYTHIHMGVHEDIGFKERESRDESPEISGF